MMRYGTYLYSFQVKPLLLSVWGCEACGVCTFERKQLRSAAAGAGRGGLSKVAGPGTKAQWSLSRLTSCFRSAFRSDDEWYGESGVCCVANMLAATSALLACEFQTSCSLQLATEMASVVKEVPFFKMSEQGVWYIE